MNKHKQISIFKENYFDLVTKSPERILSITFLLICILGVIIINYLSFLIATRKIKKDNIVDVIKTY